MSRRSRGGKDDVVVQIRVVRARGLPAADLCGTSDPFCVVRCGKNKLRTRVKKKTLEPTWAESFSLPVCSSKVKFLTVECWDKDRFKFDDPLGKMNMELHALVEEPAYYAKSRWYQLVPMRGHASSSGKCGEIELSFEIVATRCEEQENLATANHLAKKATTPVKLRVAKPLETRPAGLPAKQVESEATSTAAADAETKVDAVKEHEAKEVKAESEAALAAAMDSETQVEAVKDYEANEDEECSESSGPTKSVDAVSNLATLVFQRYDSDQNGEMDASEFAQMSLDLGYYFDEEELEQAFAILDQDGSGTIGLSEFLEFWKRDKRFEFLQLDDTRRQKVKQLSEYFAYFDRSKTGKLDHHEFRYLYENMVISGYPNLGTFQNCMEQLDLNNDGFVHFNELLSFAIKRGLLDDSNNKSTP